MLQGYTAIVNKIIRVTSFLWLLPQFCPSLLRSLHVTNLEFRGQTWWARGLQGSRYIFPGVQYTMKAWSGIQLAMRHTTTAFYLKFSLSFLIYIHTQDNGILSIKTAIRDNTHIWKLNPSSSHKSSFKLLSVSETYLRFGKAYGKVQDANNPLTEWNYHLLDSTVYCDHLSESSAWNKHNQNFNQSPVLAERARDIFPDGDTIKLQ